MARGAVATGAVGFAGALLAGVAGPAGAATGGGPAAQAPAISTVVGGVGGPAQATRVAVQSCGVTAAAGSVYVGDGTAIRRVAAGTGRLATPAGVRVAGFAGDGGPATAAELSGACGTAVDHAGNLVVADAGNNQVRVVAASTGTFYGQAMTAGRIYPVAGNGTSGFTGDGGPATSAEMNNPAGVTTDHAGNLVITDSFNVRVRVVAARSGRFYGQPMTAGSIYTVAGNGNSGFSGDGKLATRAELSIPGGTTVDATGNLVIADSSNNRVRVVAAHGGTFYGQLMKASHIYTVAGDGSPGTFGDGGPATSAELNEPNGTAVDGHGNLVIADTFSNEIRLVAASTGTFYGQPMTAGDIYTVAGDGNLGFGGDGGPATSASLGSPHSVAVDGAGNLVIADGFNNRVRLVAAATGKAYGHPVTTGDIYTIAGNGQPGLSGANGLATRAELDGPSGAAADSAGDLAVADTQNNEVRFTPASSGTFFGRAMRAGFLYTVAGDGTYGFTGEGQPGTQAQLRNPLGVGMDGNSNLLVVDTLNFRVRAVAASTGTFYGKPMTAGHIYTVAGDGTFGDTGDGGRATRAELDNPSAATVDRDGNLVITDSGNNRVRVVAASTGTFYGQAMTAGHIYAVAGTGIPGFSGDAGPATSAEMNGPFATAVDGQGNLVLTDTGNSRVRVVAASAGTFYGRPMKAGHIYTIAGTGTAGFGGDGGAATAAEMDSPTGVTIDHAGNVIVSDALNQRVRVIALRAGTFYGRPMKAGHIYTIAGTGTAGFGGDGGPASSAEMTDPLGIAITGSGRIAVADLGSNRLRLIKP